MIHTVIKHFTVALTTTINIIKW